MSIWKSNLRRLRFEHNEIPQWEVARRIGVSQAKYSEWERGYREPNPTEKGRLARFFGVPVEALEAVEARAVS